MRFPGGNWSHTLGQDIDACLRRVYYRVYGSWGGWDPRNGEEARTIYTAKSSQTLHMFVGTLVHDCAKRVLEYVRAQRPLPTQERLVERLLERFDQAVAYSSDKKWTQCRTPKDATLILYPHLAGEDLRMNDVVQARDKAVRTFGAFLQDWLPRLSGIQPVDWIAIDSLDAVQYRNNALFVAPDAAWRNAPGNYTIADWKTGQKGDPEQLAVYALWLLGKIPAMEGRVPDNLVIEGLSIPLGYPDRLITRIIDAKALDEARARIGAHLDILAGLHDRGIARDKSAFPRTEHRGRCDGCMYRFHCDFDT
jgi:hypothetical protein